MSIACLSAPIHVYVCACRFAGLFIAVVLGIGLGYYLMLSSFPTSSVDGKTPQEQDRPLQQEMGEDCCN